MLKAYQEQNFSKAHKLAEKIADNPKAKFIKALVLTYNSKKYKQGLEALQKLYLDKNISKAVWLQATLAYARLAELMGTRPEIYGALPAGIKPDNIYQELINAAPSSRTACTAMLYKLAAKLLSREGQKENEGFEELENFCASYKGAKKFTTPLHLLAENRYIFLKKDYKSAVRHLKSAYEKGIANPKDRAEILYRIGRMYDVKLNDKTQAARYYSEFLQKYPYSDNAATVKRFLNEKQCIEKE